MIKPVFDFLTTELNLTKATTFHMGTIPPNAPDNCTGLLKRVGGKIDHDNRNFRVLRIQFLTRNTDYLAGDTEANRIADAVANLGGETITGGYLYDFSGNEPGYIGEDSKGRHLFSSNFTVSARKD